MELVCLGLSHKTSPVEIREGFSLSEEKLPGTIRNLINRQEIVESVLLSTCNRMEIYATAASASAAFIVLKEHLKAQFAYSAPHFSEFYQLTNLDVAEHLFHVVSGMDSMVMGETEIFGQVKKAYSLSHQSGGTAKILNKLFQHAFQIGKKVRSQTRITQGSTSVGSVAVDLAERIFGNLKKCSLLLIGAGEMSRSTAKSLLSRGAQKIFVTNRSAQRAEKLAQEIRGEVIPYEKWTDALSTIDILITSTSAEKAFITKAELRKKPKGNPLFIIDIAVPRDVDVSVNDVEDIYLYDIDSLQTLAEEAKRERESQMVLCKEIISQSLVQVNYLNQFL